MTIIKERFGYAYIVTKDEVEQNILFAYCEGRSFLWNMYFGWRRGIAKTNEMFFWIPKRKINSLNDIIKLMKEKLDK